MEDKSLIVQGMHCASCAAVIKRRIGKMEGVEECEVNYGTEKARVKFDPEKVTVEGMNQEIGKLGYSLVETGKKEMGGHQMNPHGGHEGHDMMTPVSSDASIKEAKLKELAKLKRHVLIGLPMVVISVVVMGWEIGGETLKLWAEMPDVWMEFFHHLLPLMATYMLFVVGRPYLAGMVRFFKYGVANMDSLVGIGTSVAFLYSFVVTAFETVLKPFVNTQQNYYDVTIVVIGFITLGKWLEARSKLRTGEAIEKLLDLQAKRAMVIRGGREMEVPVEEVRVGEVVVVKPGQKIPLDGVVVEGESAVDQSMVTGESIPVDKHIKDVVIGGTMNKQGYLKLEVTRVGSETMLAQIIKLVEEAQGSKAPIERLADRVSAVFVPTVLIIAELVFVAWLVVGGQVLPFAEAFRVGVLSMVGILVIACPCAMGLATPTAIIVGVGKAAGKGILIKNAESLEKFNGVNYVVVDKTGTITKGTPQVTDVKPQEGWTVEKVMERLAALEKHSEHPLAKAIVDKAGEMEVKVVEVKEFKVMEGKGVTGVMGKEKYWAGNLKLASELGIRVDERIIEQLAEEGKTPIILMTKELVVGYVGIADTLKEEAKDVVGALHKMGIKVAMLTGDNKRTAEYIARQAGIDRVIAEVLPGEKANEIKKLQKEGYKVAMVGDGINDAPALAMADVGVAMGTGTDVAIESAGITLLGGQISKLPQAIKLARSTMRIIKQNLFWAFIYNILGIPVAGGVLYPIWGILLSPAIAGAAMGLSSVSVVMNSLRLKSKAFEG